MKVKIQIIVNPTNAALKSLLENGKCFTLRALKNHQSYGLGRINKKKNDEIASDEVKWKSEFSLKDHSVRS